MIKTDNDSFDSSIKKNNNEIHFSDSMLKFFTF